MADSVLLINAAILALFRSPALFQVVNLFRDLVNQRLKIILGQLPQPKWYA